VIDWMARAKTVLPQPLPITTVKPDETRVVSVSSVGLAANSELGGEVSSVSSAPLGGLCGAPPAPGNPYLTVEQANECHACGWTDDEIATFSMREVRFRQLHRTDAEHLAERLTLRDRQADDRRMCVECRELEISGRCAAARRGEIPGADRRLEPVPNLLIRCEAFR
jgi:hypothetical protein